MRAEEARNKATPMGWRRPILPLRTPAATTTNTKAAVEINPQRTSATVPHIHTKTRPEKIPIRMTKSDAVAANGI